MTVALQAVRYTANIGVTIALARLVAPVDFGLFAIAATFTGLLVLFKDGGVETALVSHGTVRDDEWAALGSLTCVYGLGLALACAALGPILARVYGEPRLAVALLPVALAFVFHGLDVQPSAQLLRAHRFQAHAAVELAAIFLGWAATVALAWRGAGYWALFATEPITAAGLLAGHAAAARWRPRFSFAWGPARRFLHFSRTVSGVRALGYASRNVDNLILGLAAGPLSLAYYNRAFRLIGLPQEGIGLSLNRLAVPTLSRLREQPAEFVRAFRHLTLTSIALGLPVVAFLLVSAPEIVAVVYGPRWEAVVPLLRLLGLMGLCNTFYYSASWVFTALGTVHRQLRWEAANVAVLALAFLAGVRWEAPGIALAASLAYGALRVPALLYCFHHTPVRLHDVGDVLWRPLLATAVAAGLVLALRAAVATPGPALLTVARDGVVLAAGYALGWVLVPGWRAFLRHELRRPEAAP